jgi:hypothetical protein
MSIEKIEENHYQMKDMKLIQNKMGGLITKILTK